MTNNRIEFKTYRFQREFEDATAISEVTLFRDNQCGVYFAEYGNYKLMPHGKPTEMTNSPYIGACKPVDTESVTEYREFVAQLGVERVWHMPEQELDQILLKEEYKNALIITTFDLGLVPDLTHAKRYAKLLGDEITFSRESLEARFNDHLDRLIPQDLRQVYGLEIMVIDGKPAAYFNNELPDFRSAQYEKSWSEEVEQLEGVLKTEKIQLAPALRRKIDHIKSAHGRQYSVPKKWRDKPYTIFETKEEMENYVDKFIQHKLNEAERFAERDNDLLK